MASKTTRSIVLLSIKPRYAELIVKGKKRAEFRKLLFRHHVMHIVLYASKPVQGIVGYFEVDDLEEGAPEVLWKRYGASSGINREDFDNYFAGSSTGIAITVSNVRALNSVLPLSRVEPSLTPPQSFKYLSQEMFNLIQSWR